MKGNNEIKICGAAKIQCSASAEHNAIHRDVMHLCNCLPACNSISYDFTMSESKYNLEEVWSRSAFGGHMDLEK